MLVQRGASPWLVFGGALLTLLAAFGAGLFVSAIARDSDHYPFALIDRAADKLVRTVGASASETGVRRRTFSSVTLGLEGLVVDVPRAERPGHGGALTSVGGRVLVMTFDGRFFAGAPDGELAAADIAAPGNGYQAYVEASERPPYDGYPHQFDYFRYNDVAYLETAAGRGLLISYTKYFDDDECYANVVDRVIFPAGVEDVADLSIAAEDWERFYQTRPCLPLKNQFAAIDGEAAGGRMIVDAPAGRVYLTSGDYGWNGNEGPPTVAADGSPPVPQDPNADYGKIIAIDLATGAAEHVSRGHRIPQGLTIGDDGRLWAVEHGPYGGDELNWIRRGVNYGWPLESFGVAYNGLKLPSATSYGRHDTFAKPAFSWMPSLAIGSLTTVRGFHDAWDGDLLGGTLAGRAL
ncbi:MAG: PQQ-dependent sugar dehydrogenase, partial [Caulobacterales bacterium]|nr:PQQ-dependent sugar dehydrogenase [Caulobacterales bacterium]